MTSKVKYALAGAIAATALMIGTGTAIIPGTTTYLTAADIPAQCFKSQTVITGTVVSVTDGDTMRIRHEPRLALGWSPKEGKLSETALAVRLYGVDAPETAKFGKPGQPMSKEATEFVKEQVLGKRVKLTLYRRDQYQRVIGGVSYGPFYARRDLTSELLQGGYGVLYTAGGAEYGGRLPELQALESEARTNRRGVWAKGAEAFETPGQFKARQRAEKAAAEVAADRDDDDVEEVQAVAKRTRAARAAK